MSDQAASLRAWAASQERDKAPEAAPTAPSCKQQLVVIGLPSPTSDECQRLCAPVLQRWQANGRRWVGDAAEWGFIAASLEGHDWSELASEHARWALWIDNDMQSFRRAYSHLKHLAKTQKVQQIIALHPPMQSRRGLLSNLQSAAKQFLGIQLLVFAE